MSGATRSATRRAFWNLSASEARAHARIAAVVLWVTALVILAGGTTYRDPFDQLKWTDFVHFYTLGHIARNGPVSDLYNPQTLYEHQVALVPASAPEQYLPVYPPQVALVFAPLGNLPYHLAAVLWALVNIVVMAARCISPGARCVTCSHRTHWWASLPPRFLRSGT